MNESLLPQPIASLLLAHAMTLDVQRWSKGQPLRELWVSSAGAIHFEFDRPPLRWNLTVLAVRNDDEQVRGRFSLESTPDAAVTRLLSDLEELLRAFEESTAAS